MTGHPGITEHGEQSAVIDWANHHLGTWPELRWLYAIPNWRVKAGHRILMAEEGVKKGVLDLCLPVARGGYFGWYCEMKIKPNKPTTHQLSFLAFALEEGYQAKIAYSADEVIQDLEEYLTEPRTAFPALVDELENEARHYWR